MNITNNTKTLLVHSGVFLLLALLFSALPLVLALVLDKSSLALAIFTAWYALVPPVILFLLALWLSRKEQHWLRALGRVWLLVSLWFVLQYIFSALAGVNLVFRLLSLPVTLTGAPVWFLVGALIFLVGGAILWVIGSRAPVPRPKPMVSRIALGLLIVIAVVGLPLFAIFTAQLGAGGQPVAPIPTQDQIFGYISDVYNLGERLPGSAADHKAIAYLESKLREFGYTDVRVEKTTFDYWVPTRWSITVQPDGASWGPESFYVPYTGPTKPEGITAEIVDLGNIAAPKSLDVAGKVVLVDIPATDISWDKMKLFTFMAFDPEQSVKGWHHPYPIGWGMRWVPFYQQIESRHPAGIVGILRDYPTMGRFTHYVPYDGELRAIPSFYLLPADGDRLKAEIAKGKTTVKLVLDAQVSKKGGESANVYAVLPGKSATTLIVHSHHDAPWRSGVEDSSGVGMVLGLARYYAQVPQAQRERTMLFLFTGGHMVGGQTNVDFIAKHQNDILARTLFDIVIEHIADDYLPPNPPTGKAEPRGVFMTENPVAVSQYANVVAQYNATRTLVFPTGTPLGVPTDGGQYQRAGVPVVSLISGPVWLFDDDDTLERVAKAELVPLTRLYESVAELEVRGIERRCGRTLPPLEGTRSVFQGLG